jgi:DNA repair ATPase RecN
MTPPDRLRWTDSRLDDRFGVVTDELRAIRDIPQRMGKFEMEMDNLREDVKACADSVKGHRDDFAAYLKADLRWVIATIIASGALIIAAMGLILGHVH